MLAPPYRAASGGGATNCTRHGLGHSRRGICPSWHATSISGHRGHLWYGIPTGGNGHRWDGCPWTGRTTPHGGAEGGAGEYSGIGTCLEKLGAALHGPDLVTQPVLCQRVVSGESGKISTFTTEVGSLLTFQAFLMMR